ncbi:MAG TPA: hypothetical protein VFJ58_01985 [Armatimonadota bacterium]|nr:hypothetical protein [Armatimonadota bacterium]
MRLGPATTLNDVYKTVSPEPLMDDVRFEAFYFEGLNDVRGGDRIAHLVLGLQRGFGGVPFKRFVMGHSGVGKTTELSRLCREVDDRFQVIRFAAISELDPGSFRPFDVVLLMLARLGEETQRVVGIEPSPAMQQAIVEWFATEIETESTQTKAEVEASAGAGVQGGSLWSGILGLFAGVRGGIKYVSERDVKTIQYRFARLSQLVELVNRLLDECNRLLRQASNKEWLFLGDDFDKPGIPAERIEDLFLNYANIFTELNCHLIFNVPIELAYSEKGRELPYPCECIPDTPVFRRDHSAHAEGREALQAVLAARLNLSLFDEGVADRLIVTSGVNLRDLFLLVSEAADNAILRPKFNERIEAEDADAAINNLRTEYMRSLGQSAYDAAKITYPEKAERLVSIYEDKPGSQIPDHILHSLLRARAVQEFDGERWFGVHPLVVDILSRDGTLKSEVGGKIRGGVD